MTSAAFGSSIKKHLKEKIVGLKLLLSEKEELVDLIEQYEASMSNPTSMLVRIREIINGEKYNYENFKEKVTGRIINAPDEFKAFIDQED